jgi:Sulfotransferase domain
MGSRVLGLLPYPAQRAVLHRFGRYAPWEPGFDSTPPAPAPGERCGPPDFVGIGTQKAGTTWWYSLIAAHPGVWSRPDIHKERHFLSRFGSEVFTAADLERYHGWFPRLSGTIAGEWTPDYMSYPWVPPLLSRAAPSAKLIAILRDPVERFASGLAHLRATGIPLTGETVSDAVDKGFYFRHLSWWAEHFPSENLLVLQYESCAADPVAEIARTYRFLGLDDTFRPSELSRRVSSTHHAISVDPDVAARLTDVYASDVLSLTKLVPSIDVAMWTNFAVAEVP